IRIERQRIAGGQGVARMVVNAVAEVVRERPAFGRDDLQVVLQHADAVRRRAEPPLAPRRTVALYHDWGAIGVAGIVLSNETAIDVEALMIEAEAVAGLVGGGFGDVAREAVCQVDRKDEREVREVHPSVGPGALDPDPSRLPAAG